MAISTHQPVKPCRKTGLSPRAFLVSITTLLTCAGLLTLPSPAGAAGDIEIVLSGQAIMHSSVAAADFNGDGKKEIVAGGIDGRLYVVDGATHTVIWQKQLAEYLNNPLITSTFIYSGITIADLNRDGALEIIVATGGDPNYHQYGFVVVLTYTGGNQFQLMPGWPRIAFDELGHPDNPSFPDGVPDGFESTPAAGDIDGDGDLEIVIGGNDRRLHAWHHNGNYVSGWPIDRSRSLWRGSMSSPALADIDRDGLLEIIIGTYSYPTPGCPNPYLLLALNGDASPLPGFPVYTTEVIKSSPAIGDINGDGWLDIVVGTGDWDESCGQVPDGRKVYAWDHTGQLLPGWPRPTGENMLSSPALGDLDGDGDLEVVIGCGFDYQFASPTCTYLYAWHGDGRNVTGFPMSPESINSSPYPVYNAQPFSPVLVDYDGDGLVEIMTVGAGSRGITIVKPDGTLSPDVRHATPGRLYAPPLVDDIDGDGYLETVIGGATATGKAAIFIWNEQGGIYSRRPWPMFHHDVARTGLYAAPPPAPELGLPGPVRILHQQGTGPVARQFLTIYNLGPGEFQWQVTSTSPDIQVTPPTSGTIYNTARVQLAINTTPYATGQWQYVGELVVSGWALGLPVRSSPSTVPVWLYVGDLQHLYFPVIRQGY